MEGNHPSSINQKLRLPSRKLTYPTLGEGKSSSRVPMTGDMLVPWRAFLRIRDVLPDVILWQMGFFHHQSYEKSGEDIPGFLGTVKRSKGRYFSAMSRRFLSKHPHLDEGGWHHFSAFQYIKNHHLKMTPRFLDIYWCWFHVHILPSI